VGLDVGDDKVGRQRSPVHPVQMVINRSGFVRAESGSDDVALIHGRDVWVGQLLKQIDNLIDGGDWAGARGLVGVTTVSVSCCGGCD
jgi:hypothetical protein